MIRLIISDLGTKVYKLLIISPPYGIKIAIPYDNPKPLSM